MENPFVSIIVPVYKTPEAYLRTCVESLISQTENAVQIILVDDGSPDKCPQICDEYAGKDGRILVIHQKNAGVSAARNTGIGAAAARYIIFVDADDWTSPSMCSDALEAARTYSPDVVLWDYVREYKNRSVEVRYFSGTSRVFGGAETEKLHELVLELTSGVGAVWCKMYRTAYLKENGFLFDTDLPRGQDIEFSLRAFSKITKAVYINKYDYHYRYDEGTASHHFSPCYAEYIERFVCKMQKFVSAQQNGGTLRKLLNIRTVHALLAVSVHYSFHPENPAPLKRKLADFSQFAAHPVFDSAVRNVRYADFSAARRIPLFFLKHHVPAGIYLIAKARQFQFRLNNR